MIKAVAFDIDDTLYDSTKLTTMARRNSIQAMIDAGLPGEEEELYRKLGKIIERFGPNHQRHYDELLRELGMNWNPRIIASGVAAYERTKVGYLRPFPKVVPTLLELKKRYRLAVISNGLAIKQWEKLIGLGLHHLFDAVITSEEVGAEKPAGEIFKSALREMAVKARECAMVGNKLDTDVLGANRAGILSIRIRRGKSAAQRPSSPEAKPDFEIDDISELLNILEGDGWKRKKKKTRRST